MENKKTLEELKQQCMQQYGLTEEQLDNLLAAISRVWEVVKEIIDRAFRELAETIKAAAQRIEQEKALEYTESTDAAFDLAAAIKRLQDEIADLYIYISSPPTYDRTDTRNSYYSAKLKGYKSKYMRSAAIRAPRRTARSCC